MGEYDGKKWVTAMVMVLVLLVTVAVVMALLVTVESGTYVEKFASSTVHLAGESTTLTKFAGTTLYPYSGQWNTSAVGQTLDMCAATCLSDVTCRGFFHHNALSNTAQQNACYFYRNNNVESMMGTNVAFSEYFMDTALVFGDELPGSSTDTYIKEGQAFKMFRSDFDQSLVVRV